MPATGLQRFDNNKQCQGRRIGGEHRRVFGRGQTVDDPWHYVRMLARGSRRAREWPPFKAWPPPAALDRVRRQLAKAPGGNRQMVALPSAVLTDGLAAVEVACRRSAR